MIFCSYVPVSLCSFVFSVILLLILMCKTRKYSPPLVCFKWHVVTLFVIFLGMLSLVLFPDYSFSVCHFCISYLVVGFSLLLFVFLY